MPYGRIKTPRIYVDWINWLLVNGKMSTSDITKAGGNDFATGSNLHELFDLDPANIQTIDSNGTSGVTEIILDTNIANNSHQGSNYIAFLGHNFAQAGAKISISADDQAGDGYTGVPLTAIANASSANGSNNFFQAQYNGWSIVSLGAYGDGGENEKIRIYIDDISNATYNADVKIGSIMIGKYYDFPFNPDLKFNRKDDFNNTIMRAQGGKTYSNFKTSPKSNWFLDKWAISTDTAPQNIYSSSKKIMTLSFSYMTDDSVYPANNHIDNISASTDFYSAVINKTYGSHLPVIIHFDKDETFTTGANPSNIMLARLHNININQTAVNHYSVSLTLEEQ